MRCAVADAAAAIANDIAVGGADGRGAGGGWRDGGRRIRSIEAPHPGRHVGIAGGCRDDWSRALWSP